MNSTDGYLRASQPQAGHPNAKSLTTDAIHTSDVVITMGCGDACPIFPGKRYLDWQLPDPANQNIHKVRSIRDEIEHRIRNLLTDLLPTSNEPPPHITT